MRMDYEDKEVRGGWRVTAAVLGVLGIPLTALAVARLDFEMVAAMVPLTLIMLFAGFQGRSIVHHFFPGVRPPRKPEVDEVLMDSASDEVLALVRERKMLYATRVYRQQTGASLSTSAQVVAGLAWRENERLRPTASAEVLDLVRRGKKITAIRVYREQTGADLATAHGLVEVLESEIARD